MRAKIHYIGKGLYPKDIFIREAKRLGVSRAMPIQILKTLKDGERIFLAYFERDKDTEDNTGTAKVFGYFTFNGISITGAPKAFAELEQLIGLECEEVGDFVDRRCGGYYLSFECRMKRKIPLCLIATYIELLAEETGEKPKLFAYGSFYELKQEFHVKGVKFSRSIITVDLPLELPDIEKSEEPVVFRLDEYYQRKYIPKKARDIDILGV